MGGDGSADAVLDGSTALANHDAGGGGGSAGRIRINGTVSIDAQSVISPAPSTVATTTGPLQARALQP